MSNWHIIFLPATCFLTFSSSFHLTVLGSMSRYASAYKDTKGVGDARPTALQIVQDEGLTGKLTDKVFVVTGVSSGLGIETMRALYATGGHVFGTVRNMAKGQAAVDDVKSKTKGGQITLIEMKNDSLASVRKAAQAILDKTKTINILITNAGIMAVPYAKTEDGFESQFGVCHLAHFLLFQLLKPTLLASASPSFPSRVISVSSFGHRYGRPRLNDWNFQEPNSYEPMPAYGNAKTANIWMSNEIERRYGSHDLHSTSLHPGGIWTGLQTDEMKAAYADNAQVAAYMMNAEQGAATTIYAALSDEWKDKGGKYLSKCAVQEHVVGEGAMGDDGFEDWAYDQRGEAKLWKDSLGMVGLKDDE